MKNKTKLIVEPGSSKFAFFGKKGQQLSENEVADINNGVLPCLIKLDVVKKKTKFKLFFDISDLCSLDEFLEEPIKKKTFSKILHEMVSDIDSLNEANYNLQRIFFSYDKVFISAATHEVFFIYVPVQGFDADGNLHDFFQSLIQHCKFSPKENTDYVKEYVEIFNDSASFSIFDIEGYLERINSHSAAMIRCPVCNTEVKKGTTYCPNCTHRFEEIPVKTPPSTQSHPVPRSETKPIINPVLIQKKNNRIAVINAPVFIIGRQADSCHLCIPDNEAMSKKHACIITRESGYYVMDLNSANKTKLNEDYIQPATEIEISDGDMITLADEQFLFMENGDLVL